jgi:hypothetical protein
MIKKAFRMSVVTIILCMAVVILTKTVYYTKKDKIFTSVNSDIIRFELKRNGKLYVIEDECKISTIIGQMLSITGKKASPFKKRLYVATGKVIHQGNTNTFHLYTEGIVEINKTYFKTNLDVWKFVNNISSGTLRSPISPPNLGDQSHP